MPTVKSFNINYDPAANEENTFTSGDFVSGQVTLELAKDFPIESLSITFKGKARVLWTQSHGQSFSVYHNKEKYFSFKHYFIGDNNLNGDDKPSQDGERQSTVVAPGCHVYPFNFQIPDKNMPSSFTASGGKIVYLLEARLSRSKRIDQKDSTEINFVTKEDISCDPCLMVDYYYMTSRTPVDLDVFQTPLHETKDKKMKVFNSGTIMMEVDLEKTGFVQGEGLKLHANFKNNTSRDIKPKFCLYKKHSFFAITGQRVTSSDVVKEAGETLPPSVNWSGPRVITIPHDLKPSILNCSIVKLEYGIRVYLDVKYASDPEVKLPIVILPAYGFGLEPFGNTNPPVQPSAPTQPLDPPPPYGAHGMYPPLTDFGNKHQ